MSIWSSRTGSGAASISTPDGDGHALRPIKIRLTNEYLVKPNWTGRSGRSLAEWKGLFTATDQDSFDEQVSGQAEP